MSRNGRQVQIVNVVGFGRPLTGGTQDALRTAGYVVEEVPFLGSVVHMVKPGEPLPTEPTRFPRNFSAFPNMAILVEVGPMAPAVVCCDREPRRGTTTSESTVLICKREIVIVTALDGDAVSAKRIYVNVEGERRRATWQLHGLHADPSVYDSGAELLEDRRRLMCGITAPMFKSRCVRALDLARMRRDGKDVRCWEFDYLERK